MTAHRIPADKFVIGNDPRIRKAETFNDYSGPDRRTALHNYSQPHKYKIVSIPIEPQPYQTEDKKHWCWDGCTRLSDWRDIDKFLLFLKESSPFQTDDTLILLEKWLFFFNRKPSPAETMPESLDSQCQQYNVVQVLGVEEIDPASWAEWDDGLPCPRQEWHWKLLTEVRK